MTKTEAIDFIIKKVEEIERERLSLDIDASKQKLEAVNAILKVVKGVQITNEN